MRKAAFTLVAAIGLVAAGCGSTKTTTVTTTAPAATASSVAATTTAAQTTATTTAKAAEKPTVVKCTDQPYGSGTPVTVTSAAGISCAAASAEQASYKWTGNNSYTTPGGFTCASSGRGSSGFQIRCSKGTQAYRIEFSD